MKLPLARLEQLAANIEALAPPDEFARTPIAALLARVALEIDDALSPPSIGSKPANAVSTLVGGMTSGLLASLERLLAVAQDPIRHKVFEAPSLREVVFELLVGPEGPGLRKGLSRRGGLSAVIDVARYIDEHSHERIRMPTMARRAAMSQSAFFAKFREATGATPLQYLERLRLTKGRVLLSLGASSVAEVAYTVGYASGAQFSRDFLVAFGVSPSAVLRSSRG